jgi:RNase P/RNase MRP subunit p29
MKGELIGSEAQIIYNGRPFKGIIIDETKNMLHLKTENKIVRLIKKNCIIRIKGEAIDGKNITKRPEDRIKAC